MTISVSDVARIKQIKCILDSHPHAYFDHSGGMVSLGQAGGVWDLAQELIAIARKGIPDSSDINTGGTNAQK